MTLRRLAREQKQAAAAIQAKNAPVMEKVSQKIRTASARKEAQDLEVSVTVGQTATNIDLLYLHVLDDFLQSQCQAGLSGARWISLPPPLPSGLQVEGQHTRNQEKTVGSPWWVDASARPVGAKICVKKLSGRGLHTFMGMIGYCLKDERESHFVTRFKNISDQAMADGRELHMLLGAAHPKNLVELTSCNIMHRALQFNRYKAKKPLSNSFFSCLRQMIRSGQYTLSPGWLLDRGMDKDRAESLWSAFLNPKCGVLVDAVRILIWNDRLRVDRYFGGKHPLQKIVEKDEDNEKEADDNEQTSGHSEAKSGHVDNGQQHSEAFIPLTDAYLRCEESLL